MGSFEKSDWAIDNIGNSLDEERRMRRSLRNTTSFRPLFPPTSTAITGQLRNSILKFRDQRFADEEHYEWFKDYSHFRDLILREIEPNASVLDVGCGYSELCEELYRDGNTELTCIDLSPVSAEKMKQRLSSKGLKPILDFVF